MASFTLIVVLYIILVSNVNSTRVITVFSDFSNEDDLKFFRTIFPWLVGNIGSDIRVDYQFIDTGMSSGPRKCILQMMDGNTFLQASYLKHEAEGKPKENFLYNFPIDSRKFSNCLFRNVNYYLKEAQRKFNRLRSSDTPVILVSRDNEISGMDPDLLLDGVCQQFGRREPQGCVNPTPFNDRLLYKDDIGSNGYQNNPIHLFSAPTTIIPRRLPKKTKEPNLNVRDKYFYSS
ncbi:hypothetical protein RR48_02400 [Papilio machaon]|uniref:Uncharacterized protein n=1 Tax=Papilio machaon TaxID=76193 RepID=A0A0N1PIC0_PAPMA|nr:hypothetical protein RR48_02400 [Papilio machaon]